MADVLPQAIRELLLGLSTAGLIFSACILTVRGVDWLNRHR